MSTLFKPITEAQRDVKESSLGELRPIKEKLPAITFPQLQAIAAPPAESGDLDTSGLFMGPVAEQLDSLPASRKLIKRLAFVTRAENSTLVTALLK